MPSIFNKYPGSKSALLTICYDGRADAFGEEFCNAYLKADFAEGEDHPFQAEGEIGLSAGSKFLCLKFNSGTLSLRNDLPIKTREHVIMLAVEGCCRWKLSGTSGSASNAVFFVGRGTQDLELSLGAKQDEWAKLCCLQTSVLSEAELSQTHFVGAPHTFETLTARMRNARNLDPVELKSIFVSPFREGMVDALGKQGKESRRIIEIMNFIDRNVSNPRLDCALISQHFRISKRTIYEIFSNSGTTVRETIIARRLSLAKADIEAGKGKVSSIISDYGFKTASTFYRNYRKYYEGTPR